jgi:hypothetical protein
MTMLNNEILDVNHTLGLVNHGNTHQSRYCTYRAKRGNMGSGCGGLERWGGGGFAAQAASPCILSLVLLLVFTVMFACLMI